MSYYKDIQIALDTKLNSLAGSVDIAWENVSYTPGEGTPYMRPTVLMSPALLQQLDGSQENEGIYQVDLFYPSDLGNGPLLTQADAIYDHFKSGTTLTSGSVSVYVKQISRTATVTQEGSWSTVSVDINFKVYE